MIIQFILLYALLGYLNGYLVRGFEKHKMIAAAFIIPFSLYLLTAINLVFSATLPYLIFAAAGYHGREKSIAFFFQAADFIRNEAEQYLRR